MSFINRHRLLLPLVLMSASLFAGCISIEIDGEGWGNGETGSGQLVSEQRAVSPFTAVAVGGALRVEIDRGPLNVEVTLDNNLIDRLSTVVSNNELRISCRDCSPSSGAAIRVSLPALSRIEVSGASRAIASGVDAEHLDIEISGASRIDLDGAIDVLEIDGSGASRVEGRDLTVTRLHIDLSGASRAVIEVTERVDGDLSGASHLELAGDASPIAVVDVSGGASVEG